MVEGIIDTGLGTVENLEMIIDYRRIWQIEVDAVMGDDFNMVAISLLGRRYMEA